MDTHQARFPSSLKDDWQEEFGDAPDDLDEVSLSLRLSEIHGLMQYHLYQAHDNIEKNGEDMKKKYRAGKKVTYLEGDLILLHDTGNVGGTKLEPPWIGPYSIDKHMGNDTYMLRDRHLLLPGLCHASRLKAYRPRPGHYSL
ncbi:predicted protein [Lichtheimia corymbifera JMRC:FSU:9682]|uniref:Uncharacterized protein n=1 Tax=Lichtheimia corymbifera JMRC:FSU:9682 TaxID=1263082 RepID=A0A068SDP2_9FUNG|nr:predicted protein [Lichtheimia corymbifera JMRC:FSU:9682]